MTEISSIPVVPAPRCPVTVRVTMADHLPLIDRLQKQHANAMDHDGPAYDRVFRFPHSHPRKIKLQSRTWK
jgi:hypothetical protein